MVGHTQTLFTSPRRNRAENFTSFEAHKVGPLYKARLKTKKQSDGQMMVGIDHRHTCMHDACIQDRQTCTIVVKYLIHIHMTLLNEPGYINGA